KFRPDLARIEYLSTVDDRLQWQKNALPVDDLCSENAIMLHRFNRYPLIIDPSGQAAEYIMKQFAGRNIQKTSFLDDSFRKNLESALRFGNSLLVQDVESYDPILNPGEFAVRLRQLEKALLAALNESKGKILDDNSVIGTLEKLKNEASEVAKKAAETDKVMAEVETVSGQYQRLAAACSQIYHTLQQLNEVC
ncbi:unnamed protein product, partial [Strongylus vulgaris]